MTFAPFKAHPLTRGFTQDELEAFEATTERVEYIGNELICSQGLPAPGLLLLAIGEVQVSQRNHSEGDELPICTLSGPTVVGEMELISGRSAVCSVRAVSAVVAYLFRAPRYRELLADGHSMALKLVQNISHVLVSRLIESNRRYLSVIDPHMYDSLGDALTGYWEHVDA